MLCIGECPSNSPFLKNNGGEFPKGPRPIFLRNGEIRGLSEIKIHPLYFINFIKY